MASKTFLAIGCTHRPIHDPVYCEWVIEKVVETQPDVMIHVGDLFDEKCVSRFVKNNAPTLKSEYDDANDFLDAINHALPNHCEKHYLEGNHCSRIWREEHAHLSDLIDYRLHVPAISAWRIYDYRYHPSCVFRCGQITAAHGFGHSIRAGVSETIQLGEPNGLHIRAHTHRGHGPEQLRWGQKLQVPFWHANTGCGIKANEGYFQTYDTSAWNRGLIRGNVTLGRFIASKPRWSAEFLLHSTFWGKKADDVEFAIDP